MKDLDFDELDKAVNSLMAGVPKTPVPSSEAPEKTVNIPSTTDATLPIASSPPSVAARSTPAAVPASRRGGRFMDVVHPSSAMKKEKVEPTRSVSRQGVTLKPSSEVAPEPKTSISSPEPTPLETPVTTSDVLSEPEAPKNEWPDPLDIANFTDSDNEKDQEPKKTESIHDEQPFVRPAKTEESVVETPLVSPFLPDTKVEKRPLGANAAEANQDTDENKAEISEDLPPAPNDDQLPATAENVKSLLPEELHSDLVAIESDTTSPNDSSEDTVKPEKTDTPWVAPKQESKNDIPETKPEPKPEVKEKETPAPGLPSIPQQYREEPSTGDQKNGAIYDTDSYHQPLAHPTKQKSGWMWIVWILIILVVGAGGGAAAYFLGLV